MPLLGSMDDATAHAPEVTQAVHFASCLAVSGNDDDAKSGISFGKLPHLGSRADAAVLAQDVTRALPFGLWLGGAMTQLCFLPAVRSGFSCPIFAARLRRIL
eukprot:268412-Amphidinium_carterae.1